MAKWLMAALALAALAGPPVAAQETGSHAHDIPSWFAETFLDFRDDLRDATKQGRRLMLYFGQDGCPYCRALMQTNFSQKAIADKTRRHFVAIALDLWGDREVTWIDGAKMSEKELARRMKVQFTPTVLFLDEKGEAVARLNGYYPPHRFDAVLDYVAGHGEAKETLAAYLSRAVKETASPTLHDEPFFMKSNDLRRGRGAKPLAVLFETPHCAGCDELHREGFRRPEVRAVLERFDVARHTLSGRAQITTPEGRVMRAGEWARELKIVYTPSVVFFSPEGREVFRIEAYLRPFHFSSSFEYVASGAYRSEPNFQRFLRAKAARMRAQGRKVDLWK